MVVDACAALHHRHHILRSVYAYTLSNQAAYTYFMMLIYRIDPFDMNTCYMTNYWGHMGRGGGGVVYFVQKALLLYCRGEVGLASGLGVCILYRIPSLKEKHCMHELLTVYTVYYIV